MASSGAHRLRKEDGRYKTYYYTSYAFNRQQQDSCWKQVGICIISWFVAMKLQRRAKRDLTCEPDAIFEVLGSPYSLLSVSLSPSQDLHTRRGSLVGLSGTPDNTVSSLRILSPIRRALVGIPFMYQKITSTTPINALITTKSPLTSFTILQLDGTSDWKLAQRKALLAWTGSSLSVKPSINARLSVAYWGSSDITGRGLLALAGQGQIFSIELAEGESYVAHPSNILAYSTSSPSPLPTPYRFKSSNFRFQIPTQLGNFFPSSKFVQNMKTTKTYKFFSQISLRIRTWSRRTIWGDRLFLNFEGPTTILLQSRAARVSDVLTAADVKEIADAPAGVVQEAITQNITSKIDAARTGLEGATPSAQQAPVRNHPKVSVASISRDGKVTFETAQNPNAENTTRTS
jgi:uncharacterized protein (AIM24 family)